MAVHMFYFRIYVRKHRRATILTIISILILIPLLILGHFLFGEGYWMNVFTEALGAYATVIMVGTLTNWFKKFDDQAKRILQLEREAIRKHLREVGEEHLYPEYFPELHNK